MAGPAMALARWLPFYYGWIVVAVAFVTLGIGYTARSVFSLLFPPILAEFGWDRALTASIFSVGFFSAVLYAPLIGYSIERLGPHIVLPVATVLVSAGFVLTTISTEPWHFIGSLGVLVVGATTFLAFNGHFVFVPKWFETRRGLALGLISSGAGVFALLLLPMFQQTIDEVGWRTGCLGFAALLMAVVFPLTLILQRRAPEDLGLLVDGRKQVEGSAGGQREGGRRLVVVDPAWAAIDWTLARAARTWRFWMVGLGFATSLFAWYALMVHQTQYLLDAGFDTALAAMALGLVSAFGIFGQIGLGLLSDRIGREWVWTLSMGGFAVSAMLLMVIQERPEPWLVLLMTGIQGFLGYALTSVYGAVPADIFQGRHYGFLYGTMTIFGSAGAAAGPWVFGILYDLNGNYTAALWLEIGVCIVSALSIWIAAPRKVRRVVST
jgi:MFS family permease